MSGLYNSVFGKNPNYEKLLAILNLELDNIPRFRDILIKDNNIIIYTRTGGGNREYYDDVNFENKHGPWNSTLRKSSYYVKDEDDAFDKTYANFYFSFPPEHKKDLEAFEKENLLPSQKWKILFDNLDKENKL